MVFKNFRIICIIRIISIVLTIFLLAYIIFQSGFHITPVLLSVVIFYQIFALIHYVEKTNRYLTNFLESIRYSDFSRSFQIEGLGKAYDDLKAAFNQVIMDFQKIRSEKETNFHYLQNVIQHIGIGLIAYTPDGSVELINNATKKLLRLSKLRNIDHLEEVSSELVKVMKNLRSGSRALVKVQNQDDYCQLIVSAKEFKLKTSAFKLISLQNIQTELEEQELVAWQKLISVLTHEIMNSITPISSLSSTVNEILNDFDTTDNKPQEIADETIIDIQNALRTIHRRSDGLLHFVNTYRNLTKIPKPDFSIFQIIQLFDNITGLMGEELRQRGIDFIVEIEPEDLDLTADQKLIEQILINLIKNSMQALEKTEQPRIALQAYINYQNRVTIQITDNGCGILENVIDK
ncbi:MAG: ATP-binding protein, partial [Candidatus Cloacimonetes bacterium]|nr:ATP-binding protein [Candidatus Cloacimonadota bacterium]